MVRFRPAAPMTPSNTPTRSHFLSICKRKYQQVMLTSCLKQSRKNQQEIIAFGFMALLHLNQACLFRPIAMEDMAGVAGAADAAYCLFAANVAFPAFAYPGNRHIRTLVGMHDVVTISAFCSPVLDVRESGFR